MVSPGDTLIRIARRYRVTVDVIRRANRLRSANVRIGRRLTIPRTGAWRQSSGRRYSVRAGDTLARIARRHRTTITDLRAANGLRSDNVRVGQMLHVPRPGQRGAALRAQMRSGNQPTVEDVSPELDESEEEATEERARRLGLGPVAVGQRLLREAASPELREEAGDAEAMEGTLLLPVEDGVYLRGWGSGTDGYHLAVDIGAPTGTEVHAAARGMVVYAGRAIRGYGNMVVLVHPNGWVTGYAHHQRNGVVAGQIVERGERIAFVGQTGFARGPHLHFILAFEGRHCDPTPLFTPRIHRRNGEEVDEPQVVWDAERRPSAVRCLERAARPHPHYSRGRSRRGRRGGRGR